jgi:hypothetical protein
VGVNPSRATLIAALGLSAGCGPSLATLQPAHVAPKGHMQATAAFEVGVPTGTITRIIDTGKTLAEAANSNDLTPAQEQQLFESGIVVAASPPSFGYHFALAYTVLEGLEVNGRYAGDGWRLGARYQLLRHENGPFDMVIGAGVARSVFEIPLTSYIPILKIDDLTRWTIDVPLQIGTSRPYYRVWGGPKFLYSHLDMAMRLEIPYAQRTDLATFEGRAMYFGGQVGFAIGYRYVFFAVELTMARIVGSADVKTASPPQGGGPDPIARSVDITGFIIYPAFGFIGEF